MTKAKVALESGDIVRLILQFFNAEKLHKSMRNLEKESGVTNCDLSEDVLFLRQLILDGEWDAILTFAQPLEAAEGFDVRKFRYLVLRQKFMEVLYFKSGIEGVSKSYSIEDLIKCLNHLEKDCPFKSDYTKLCWLLTVPDLSEQPEYQNWNPETARIQCFEEVLEILRAVMPVVKKRTVKRPVTPNEDRLTNLIVKGLCFESCVEYCQQRALNGDFNDDNNFTVSSNILCGTSHESTGNFISWLKSLPQDSYVSDFEPMDLDVNFHHLTKAKAFRFSNKKLQSEAENLSKSMTFNRPSTAEAIVEPSKEENQVIDGNHVTRAIAGMTKVSNSYHEFKYNPKNSHFQPIKKTSREHEKLHKPEGPVDSQPLIVDMASSQGNQIPNSSSKQSRNEGTELINPPEGQGESSVERQRYENLTENTHRNIDDAEGVQRFNKVRDSVQIMRNEQEQSVLQQLQEHEQYKQELQRELMGEQLCLKVTDHQHITVNNHFDVPNTSDTDGLQKSPKQQHLSKQTDSNNEIKELPKPHIPVVPNQDNRLSPEGLETGKMYTDAGKGEEPSLEFDDGNFPVMSTPLGKHKPAPLVLNEESAIEMAARQPVTPVNQKHPNAIAPGHWVALADGSGVLNTSTPKSTKNKPTPAPLASPVLPKGDGQHGTPLSAMPEATGSSDENLQGKDGLDATQGNQDPPARKGPKINGVRRSLTSSQPHTIGKLKNATPTGVPQDRQAPRHSKPLSTPRGESSSPNTIPDRVRNQPGSGNSSPRSGASSPLGRASSPNSKKGSRVNSPIGARRRANSPGPSINSPRGRAESPSNAHGRASSPSGTRGPVSGPSGARGSPHQPRGRASSPGGARGRAASPKSRLVSNQKQVTVKQPEQSDATNGTTFLVEKVPSNGLKARPAINEAAQEPQEYQDMGKPASQCIDVTYQKQTCNDPAAPHVSHGQEDWSRLRNHQQNFLRTTTEPTRFRTIALLEDLQAIRAVAFHPTGKLFAIGSNSKILRICASPDLENFTNSDRNASQIPPPPTILFKRTRHHRGSIYCMAWSSTGDLIATGSNDKSIKVLHFDADNCTQVGPELELNIHSGTIRDLSFVSRASGSAVLVSGGAGNGNIQISDCTTGNTIGQLKGHSSHIMSVYAAKDDIIASGSNDNTVRLWDLRSQRCIDAIATGDSCVSSVCVNPSGTLLVSGHEDGGCMLYDITAGRTLQFFKPHTADCRSVRFSPDGHHLLSCSYDTSTILMEMQHDLECNIPPYSVVAQHDDKMIQCRWHPFLMAFVSSSADRTARLWTLDC